MRYPSHCRYSRSERTSRLPPRPHKLPRRKAKQERSRETVKVILDAAAQVLIRDGYALTTTNRVAERAGVSVGSIYQYFGNKDEMFAELLDREVTAVLDTFAAAKPSDRDLEGALRRILSLAVEAWSYGPQLYRRFEHVPEGILQTRLAEAKNSLTVYIRSLLEHHREELRVNDLDVATYVVINTAIGLSANASPEMYRERYVDMTCEILERYLITGS